MKPKKYTAIQRIKRLENIVSQIYMNVVMIKKQLEIMIKKQLEKSQTQNPEN
jgi:hypothetical protein